MNFKFDLIIKNGIVVLPWGLTKTDIAIVGDKIFKFGIFNNKQAKQVINVSGLHVLPGIIDSHVHFREPGLKHKETIETGSKAAIMGGVTSFCEMPNTKPQTININSLKQKLTIAKQTSWANYGFYFGVSLENINENWESIEKIPGCAGIKIFVGSSTGNMLIDNEKDLSTIFIQAKRAILLHCEDEGILKKNKLITDMSNVKSHSIWRSDKAALKATSKVLRLAKKTNAKIHILHITTKQEINLLANFKHLVSCEVCPHHLFLSIDDYQKLGNLIQVNPPIRDNTHQQALWYGIKQGIIDTIGSDHAPHLLEEKKVSYPNSPSGMPGIQTMLPLMLTAVNSNKLSLLHLVQLLATNPAKILGIQNRGQINIGKYADFAIIDLKKQYFLENKDMLSKSKHTPFSDLKVQGKVIHTIVNGKLTMTSGDFITKSGQQITFR